MLNANEANESVWMGSRTPVTCKHHSEYFMTIFLVKIVGDNVIKKDNVLTIFCGEIHVFRSNFRKERV